MANWFTSDGVFKSLGEEEVSKLEAQDLRSYMLAKSKAEEKERAEELESFKKETGEMKESLGRVEEVMKEQSKTINSIKEMKGGFSTESIEKEVYSFISKNHDEIKRMESKGSGLIELTLKAPENITTTSGSNPNGIPDFVSTQIAPPSNINLRGTFVESLTTNLSTDLVAYPYTETLPKEGDFAFLGEGEIKPQIDFKWETDYAKPVKIAAWQRLTTESIQDVRGLQSIATDYLRKKHDLKKQNGLLFGDGISPNPKGATSYGRAFSAGGLALGVENPNIMDVLNACATDIYTTHNYIDELSYMPTLAVINPEDFYLQFVAVKNSDGNPLYPTASLFNRVNIGGMTIIPERSIPAGKLFVADMSKYNTTNYIGYSVKIGWVDDDFIKNQFVILGESRFHAFVKKTR